MRSQLLGSWQMLRAAQQEANVRYDKGDKIEVRVRLYMNRSDLGKHDLDNRLKDVMDALQARVGGPNSPW